jgi:hypothetical protein
MVVFIRKKYKGLYYTFHAMVFREASVQLAGPGFLEHRAEEGS